MFIKFNRENNVEQDSLGLSSEADRFFTELAEAYASEKEEKSYRNRAKSMSVVDKMELSLRKSISGENVRFEKELPSDDDSEVIKIFDRGTVSILGKYIIFDTSEREFMELLDIADVYPLDTGDIQMNFSITGFDEG